MVTAAIIMYMLGCVKSVYNLQGNNSLTHTSQCDGVKTLSVSSRSDPVTCGDLAHVPLRNNAYIRVKIYACWIWCAKKGQTSEICWSRDIFAS